MEMERAISMTGVLKKKKGMLRRKEGRVFVLTNEGGLFQVKGIAGEFYPLKLVLRLTTSTDVRLEKAGSGESTSVIKVYNRGQNGPSAELEAMSVNETAAWSEAMKDVIELLSMINGDPSCALHRPLQGLQKGEEGWYLEPTGRMALYTLNQKGMWKVQDRREYDEATIMHWMANRQQQRRADFPVQGDGDSFGEDSVSPRSSVRGNSGASSVRRIADNVASKSLTKQIKNVPFFHGTETEFPKFRRDFITLVKQHGLFHVFTGDVEIPVADEDKSDEEFQAMGFADEEVRAHFLAWNILCCALKSERDIDILRCVTSPTAAWRVLVSSYSATTRGAKLRRLKVLTSRCVTPGSNPIHTLSEMADDAREMRVNGTYISDEIVCLLFLNDLPKEYDAFRQMIECEKETLTINGLMDEFRARYDL